MKFSLFVHLGVCSLCIAHLEVGSKAQVVGGALDLDVFKNLGSDTGKGWRFIDSGGVIRRKTAEFSAPLKGAPGPGGARPPPSRPAKAPRPVDLCYVVDVTGSMSPFLEAIKSSIRDTVTALQTRIGAATTLRLCFIGYRDLKDAKPLEVLPFTTDVNRFLAFVDAIRATGGADRPEDVFGGLEAVGTQAWSAPTRIVLHIADQPCHGSGCGGGTADPKGRNADNVFRPIRADKLKYNFGRIRDSTDTMMKLFSEAYGQEIQVFDMSIPQINPAPRPAPRFCPPGGRCLPGAPGPAGPDPDSAGVKSILKKKVGEASIAAVLLGIS